MTESDTSALQWERIAKQIKRIKNEVISEDQ